MRDYPRSYNEYQSDYPSSFNYCRIDLGALARNYKRICEFNQGPVMAVVKGDAYGHGLIPCARALATAGCQHFGVLDLEEARNLGFCGLKAKVTILAGLWGSIQSIDAVVHSISVFAYDLEQIQTLAQAAGSFMSQAQIWLKIDTGMGRLGIPWTEMARAIKEAASDQRIKLLGLATHLATNGDKEAEEQLSRLKMAGEMAKQYLDGPLLFSATASGGILAHQDFPDDLRRAGLLLYGYSPLEPGDPALQSNPKAKSLIKSLEPVMTVATRLIQVREAKAGETISYDRTFKADKPIRFGTAPFGYVHGMSRTRSSKGHALIGGRESNLLGRVCMNLTMYELSGKTGRPGDEVVLMGRQGKGFIGADLFGSWQQTSAYEILCHLGRSNPRHYVET
ncbi:MAG: alanine racemase [Deltaproteobacteria bacterium]|jgi:alanine racemase|nr:alanine racemase [Deltaproteobacteria bacterium]